MAHNILDAKKPLLKKSAELLLEKETIEGDILKQLIAEDQQAQV
jgi:ATP-dependent Zn protease